MERLCIKKPLLLLVLAMLSACGGDGDEKDPVDPLDREPMLTHWVDNIMVPAYDTFKIKFDVFVATSNAFAANPNTTTLTAFREAWVNAYVAWEKVEIFEVGPGDKYVIRSFFNIYPADVAGITQNINDPQANLGVPAAYPRQGFPAFDYLINGLAEDDDAIVRLYTTDGDAAKRIAYVQRLTERMKTILNNVMTEWKGAYRDTFISKTGLDIGSSTGLMVNSYVLYYERYIRSGKFGIPSGAMANSGGVQYPEKVEAYYKKDISLTLAKTAHQAAVDFFNGKSVVNGEEGPSFKSYLNALDARDKTTNTLLSEIINNQFAAAAAKFDLLNENLYEQVQNDNQKMIDTYTEMQKAVRMLKVDMTSAMSVTITYTDNDGD